MPAKISVKKRQDILSLFQQGWNNKDIAQKLQIDPTTVADYVKDLEQEINEVVHDTEGIEPPPSHAPKKMPVDELRHAKIQRQVMLLGAQVVRQQILNDRLSGKLVNRNETIRLLRRSMLVLVTRLMDELPGLIIKIGLSPRTAKKITNAIRETWQIKIPETFNEIAEDLEARALEDLTGEQE